MFACAAVYCGADDVHLSVPQSICVTIKKDDFTELRAIDGHSQKKISQ